MSEANASLNPLFLYNQSYQIAGKNFEIRPARPSRPDRQKHRDNLFILFKRSRDGSRHLRERSQSSFLWLSKDQPPRGWQGIRAESLQTYSGLSRPVLHNDDPYR